VQRQRALAAVLSLSPLTSGDTVIAELYSPNLDQYQRMLILDALAGAAAEMADPRKAPQLALQGHQQAPKLLPPAATGAKRSSVATLQQQQKQQPVLAGSTAGLGRSNGVSGSSSSKGSSSSERSAADSRSPGSAVNGEGQGKTQAAPGLVASSSRVWGNVSLQKQADAAANPSSSGSRTFKNRFAPIALRWTAALLQQCDVPQQSIDLFGRDSLLLGRLLTVLGSFVEAAAETPAAVPLCAGLMELLKAKELSGHKEVCAAACRFVWAAAGCIMNMPTGAVAASCGSEACALCLRAWCAMNCNVPQPLSPKHHCLACILAVALQKPLACQTTLTLWCVLSSSHPAGLCTPLSPGCRFPGGASPASGTPGGRNGRPPI
jgi:hypothetical protein